MSQIQVEIIETQVMQRPAARSNHIVFAVLVVPELRGNPKLFAGQSFGNEVLQRDAHLGLVSVDRRAIEVAITNRSSHHDRLRDLLRCALIGTEGAQPYGRHFRAGVKRLLRHGRGIDTFQPAVHCSAHLGSSRTAP